MRKKRKEFSKEEDQFIIDNQQSMTVAEMASVLGRPDGTVDGRKKILFDRGLITNFKRWHFIKKVVDYMYQGESFGFKRKMDRCFHYLTKYKEPRKRGGTTSKYRGVSWSNHTRNYVTQITHGSQKIHQRFDDETLAAQTYDTFAKQFFGNKAILNFS